MIAYVSAIAKSGEPNPSVMPIAVARPETVAECALGIPPVLIR